MFQEIGKIIFLIGLALVFLGGLFWFFGKAPFIGRLPGDILIKRDGFTFYAPITTGILISIVLSLLLTLFLNLRK